MYVGAGVEQFPNEVRGNNACFTNPGEAGYSLLEMLVILAIVSMFMAAMPTLYTVLVPNFQVRQFAYDIADTARSLRTQAKTNREIHVIQIVEGSNSLLVDGEAMPGPDAMVLGFDADFAWNTAYSDRIEFYPNGASSGGTITLEKGGLSIAVKIDWASGRVEVEQ